MFLNCKVQEENQITFCDKTLKIAWDMIIFDIQIRQNKESTQIDFGSQAISDFVLLTDHPP